MVKKVGIAEARSRISEIIGEVYFKRQQYELEKKGKPVAILQDIDTYRHLISSFRMKCIVKPDDGQYMAYCPELDIVTTLDTKEEAIEDLIDAIKEYSERYMREFELYANSPNRAKHLPYVLAVLFCENDEEVKKITGL